MGRFVIARIAGAFCAIVGASILAFVLMRAIPGDPARLILGPLAPPSAVASLHRSLGLDKPIYTQYWIYVREFVHGNWGYSYSQGETVRAVIGQRLPATIELGLFAFGVMMAASVGLAMLVTYRHRPAADRVVRGVAYVGLGTPPFVSALVLLLVFAVGLGVLPGPEGRLSPGAAGPPTVTGLYTLDALIAGQMQTFWDAFVHLILPGIALGFAEFAFVVRLLRANLLEISREPFLTVARAKGLGRWSAFRRHAVRNAFLPTLTVGGILLAEFLAGSVLVETVFNWPGVGATVVNSILTHDYAFVQTFIVLSACVFVVVNLTVDLLYAVIDPRVRTAAVLA